MLTDREILGLKLKKILTSHWVIPAHAVKSTVPVLCKHLLWNEMLNDLPVLRCVSSRTSHCFSKQIKGETLPSLLGWQERGLTSALLQCDTGSTSTHLTLSKGTIACDKYSGWSSQDQDTDYTYVQYIYICLSVYLKVDEHIMMQTRHSSNHVATCSSSWADLPTPPHISAAWFRLLQQSRPHSSPLFDPQRSS